MENGEQESINSLPSEFDLLLTNTASSFVAQDDLGELRTCSIFCPSGRLCPEFLSHSNLMTYEFRNAFARWWKANVGGEMKFSVHNATPPAQLFSNDDEPDFSAFKSLLECYVAVFINTRKSSGSSILASYSQSLPTLRISMFDSKYRAHSYFDGSAMDVRIELQEHVKWEAQITDALDRQLGPTIIELLGNLAASRASVDGTYAGLLRLFRAGRLMNQKTIEDVAKRIRRPQSLIRLLERRVHAWTLLDQTAVNSLLDSIDLTVAAPSLGFHLPSYADAEFAKKPELALGHHLTALTGAAMIVHCFCATSSIFNRIPVEVICFFEPMWSPNDVIAWFLVIQFFLALVITGTAFDRKLNLYALIVRARAVVKFTSDRIEIHGVPILRAVGMDIQFVNASPKAVRLANDDGESLTLGAMEESTCVRILYGGNNAWVATFMSPEQASLYAMACNAALHEPLPVMPFFEVVTNERPSDEARVSPNVQARVVR